MQAVSLYIPAYNVESHIERCVRAVLAQTHPVDEILVVDDGSRDRTVEIAAALPKVRVIRHAENRGLGAARNTALREARHELVAALDADTAPARAWLAHLVPHLDDPRVAAASGALAEAAIHRLADRWRRAFMTQSWGPRVLRNPPFMYGNNTLVRKSVALAVGGYNATLRTNGEDVDFSHKLRAAGFDIMFDPGAVVEHHRTDTLRSILDTRWRWYYFGLELHKSPLGLADLPKHAARFWGIAFLEVFTRSPCWRDPSLLVPELLYPYYMTYRLVRQVRQTHRAVKAGQNGIAA